MVPVLLLTGFLGSGKTTLLNHLLENRPRQGTFAEASGKLALIVNEFGTVGIDADLLPKDMTRQIELPGGCICCRLDEDLEKTLLELLDTQPDLSAIIIETTGIAEPLPISWNLTRESLVERVRLAAILTVVDALEHERHRLLSPTVDLQVEYADLIIISKQDLVEPQALVALQNSLRQVNQVAPILDGPPAELLPALWETLDDPELESQAAPASAPAETRSHHHFESVVVPIATTLDLEALTEALEGLPANYLRIKGISLVVDRESGSSEPQMIAFHRVGARVSAEPARAGLESRVVAIGTGLDRDRLAACIEAAVVP